MKIIFFILSFILLSQVAPRVPGVKVAVHPEILNTAKDDYIPKVLDQILATPIPDMEQSGMKLTNIKIQSIDLKPENINISFKDNYIEVEATDFAIKLTMKGSKKVFLFNVNADLTATASQSKFTFSILSQYKDGKLKFKVTDVNVDIQNEKLKTDNSLAKGQVSDLVKSGEFRRILASTFEKQLKSNVQETLNAAGNEIPNSSEIPSSPLSVDYTQTSDLVITTTTATASMDGTIYITKNGYTPENAPEADVLPNSNPESIHDIQIFISNYVFNSALHSLWQENFFAYTFTNDMIPKDESVPISLDTTSLSVLFPGLEEKYPGQLVKIDWYDKDEEAPKVEFKDEKAIVTASTSLEVSIWDQTANTWTRAFILNSILTVGSKLSVDPNTNNLEILVESANVANATFTDVAVENVETRMIADQLTMALGGFLPFSYELPLPQIPQITLDAPELTLHDGYVEIGAYGKKANAAAANTTANVTAVNTTATP